MFVQKCVRQHYPFGGGVFSNIDEILNTLIRTKTEFEGFERPTTEQECWWIYPKNTPLTVVQKSIDKC
jgi:hypothetical protein